MRAARLASGSRDHTIRIWSQRHGKWSGSVMFVAEVAITALTFARPDGILAAGDASGRVHYLKLEGLARTQRDSRIG